MAVRRKRLEPESSPTRGDEEASRLAEALGLPTTRWRNAGEREDRRRYHAFEAFYDLHAGVRVGGRDRAGLERLARYVTRPVPKLERPRELAEGRLVLGGVVAAHVRGFRPVMQEVWDGPGGEGGGEEPGGGEEAAPGAGAAVGAGGGGAEAVPG